MNRTIQKTFRMLAGAAAAALSLFGCTQELYTPQAITGPVAARFIADITPAARVNQKGTDWTDGDCIGITGAGYTNVPYVRESGQFVPEDKTIYFNDTETKTFNAYYPYQSVGGTLTVSTAADKQGTGIDFLFASGAEGSTYEPEVSFTDKTDKGGPDNSFHHCMSLIKFTFKAGDGISFSETEPAVYTLYGLKHEGTFDTATGTTAVTAAAESLITMQLGGATTSQVILTLKCLSTDWTIQPHCRIHPSPKRISSPQAMPTPTT